MGAGMRTSWLIGGVLLLVGTAAFLTMRGGTVESWREVSRGALADRQQEQLERAAEARGELAGVLMATLVEAVETEGLVGAISVCADEAPRLVASVQRDHETLLGRTSWKRRSDSNQPPAWAGELVAARTSEEHVLVGPGGRLAVLTPIVVAPFCLQCHGDPDDMDPGVTEELALRYPDDAATGFRDGDLRGWFWVEVPGGD